MFISALFAIVNPWTQSRCPTIDEENVVCVYIYAIEYHSAIKKKEIFICRKMEGAGDHQVEPDKPSSKNKKLHVFTICGI
jgi:hypothetical protein